MISSTGNISKSISKCDGFAYGSSSIPGSSMSKNSAELLSSGY